MFASLAPIEPDSRADAAIDSILARIDAIATVLHVLGRMADRSGAAASDNLEQRARLSARLAACDAAALARMTAELDAVSAVLQSGFAALDQARRKGQPAPAAIALLYREASEDLAAILASAETA